MVRSALVSTCLVLAPVVWAQGPTAVEVLLGLQQSGSYLGVGVIDVNEAAASRVEAAAARAEAAAAKASPHRMYK